MSTLKYFKKIKYHLRFFFDFFKEKIKIIRQHYIPLNFIPYNSTHNKGMILVTVMLALLVISIFLPALYFVISNETKWSVKQKKTTTAFHMAEAGLDRGVWKLQESDAIWNMVSTNGVVAGYNFDVVYISSTAAGEKEGEYKIKLTTAISSSMEYIKVISIGRDISTNETRSIESVYYKTGGIEAGLQIRGTLSYASNMHVHWGPVVCYGNITNSNSDYFPRKICKGFITGRDDDPNPPNGHDYFQDWPNPSTYDYNSYQLELGSPPDIKLNEYKEMAKKSSIPRLKEANGNNPAEGNDPVGSGYYDGSENKDYELSNADGSALRFYNSTSVIFIDNVAGSGNAEMKDADSQLRLAAVVVKGNFDVNGDNTPAYSVKIPEGAMEEYNHSSASATWTSNFQSTGEGNMKSLSKVKIHGYVYVGGSSNSGGGDPVFVGVVDVVGGWSTNNTYVYYDADVSTGILTSGGSLRRQSWRETKQSW